MVLKVRLPRINGDIIDIFSIVVIFLFSTHDAIVRLFPALPYSTLCIFSLCLLVLLVSIFSHRLNGRALIFFLMIYCVVLFNASSGTSQQIDYIKTLFFGASQTSKLWAYFIVFSLIRDEKKWSKYLLYLAYINMILVIITSMSGLYSSEGRDINYLGVGITGAVWIPVILQRTFIIKEKHRATHLVTSVAFTVFISIYGNRGSVVAILTFLIYCILRYVKVSKKVQLSIYIGTVVLIIYNIQDVIRKALLLIVSHFGITSRNLTLLLQGQLAYTTHRTDDIWIVVFDAIKKKPFWGYGLCYDRVLFNDISGYAHNLVLETWVSFGLIIGTILLVIHFWIGIRMCLNKEYEDWSNLFAPFFVSMTMLLMFNNSFCQLGYFWICYGLYFSFQKNIKKTKLIKERKLR